MQPDTLFDDQSMPSDQEQPTNSAGGSPQVTPRHAEPEPGEPLLLIDRTPGSAELLIRAIFGAIAGAITALAVLFSRLFKDITPEGWRLWLSIALVAGLFAYFAATRGDRFWGAGD